MEQLNRIELRGMVGTVRQNTVGEDKLVVHFTVATSRAYRDQLGAAVIETTWHNVTAWKGKGLEEVDLVKKGDKVYVIGRLKNTKFMGSDNIERNATEVIASRVVILEGPDTLAYEM